MSIIINDHNLELFVFSDIKIITAQQFFFSQLGGGKLTDAFFFF